MTHKEIFEALLDGKKIRFKTALNHKFIYLTSSGLRDQDGFLHPCAFDEPDKWEIYQEPKKKVVRWLWAQNNGEYSGFMMSEQESEGLWPIKLEWSRQEFEE